jgi:hypothetical protein
MYLYFAFEAENGDAEENDEPYDEKKQGKTETEINEHLCPEPKP